MFLGIREPTKHRVVIIFLFFFIISGFGLSAYRILPHVLPRSDLSSTEYPSLSSVEVKTPDQQEMGLGEPSQAALGMNRASSRSFPVSSPLAKMMRNSDFLRADLKMPANERFFIWDFGRDGEPSLRVVLRFRGLDGVETFLEGSMVSSLPMNVIQVIKSPFPIVELSVPFNYIREAHKLFSKLSSLQYFEPEVMLRAAATDAFAVVNDPIAQWGVEAIGVPRAWLVTTGSKNVKVAIIDSGVDLDHPDLLPNLGSIGYDWIDGDDVPDDENGHGTHVAGIIAAVLNNSLGIPGIANVTLHVERILDQNGQGSPMDAVKAMTNAVKSGARIITASWGSFGSSQILREVTDWVYGQNALVIAAAGNYARQREFYPAAFPNVVAVSAIDSRGAFYSYSNRGNWIDVAAPGVSITSTVPGGGYGNKTGTSMAAPHVAGVAALALSLMPELTSRALMNLLRMGTDDLGSVGKDPFFGYGLINASKVIEIIHQNVSAALLGLLTTNPSTPFIGEQVTVSLELYDVGLDDLRNLQASIELEDGTIVRQFSDVSISRNIPFRTSFEWKIPLTVSKGWHELKAVVVDDNGQQIPFLNVLPRDEIAFHVAALPQYQLITSTVDEWISLDDSNSQRLSLEDDDSVSISLPFNFSFYDVVTDKIWIGSNGLLSFRDPVVDYYSLPFPLNDFSHQDVLAFAWTDLSPPGNPDMQIRYEVTNNFTVVQFLQMGHYLGNVNFGDVQVILQSDGTIDVTYRDFDFSYDVGVVMGMNLGRIPKGLSVAGSSFTWNLPSWKGDFYSLRIIPLHLKSFVLFPLNGSLHLKETRSDWSWKGKTNSSITVAQFYLYLDDTLILEDVPTDDVIQIIHSSEGQHSLFLHVVDSNGVHYRENVTFIVDLSSPFINAVLPENNTVLSSGSSSALVVWSVVDAHSYFFVDVILDGWPLAGGSNGSIQVTDWGKLGQHELQVIARDAAGNVAKVVRSFKSTEASLLVDSRARQNSAVIGNGPFRPFVDFLINSFPFSGYMEVTSDELLDRYSLAGAGLVIVPYVEVTPDWWMIDTLLEWGLRRGGLMVIGPPQTEDGLLTQLAASFTVFLEPLSVELVDMNVSRGSVSRIPRLASHPLSVGLSSAQWERANPRLAFHQLYRTSSSEHLPVVSLDGYLAGTLQHLIPFSFGFTVEHSVYLTSPSNSSQTPDFQVLDFILSLRSIESLDNRVVMFPEGTFFLNSSTYSYPTSFTAMLIRNVIKWLLPGFYNDSYVGLTVIRPYVNETIKVESKEGDGATTLTGDGENLFGYNVTVEWDSYVPDLKNGLITMMVDDVIILANRSISLAHPTQEQIFLNLGSHEMTLILYLEEKNIEKLVGFLIHVISAASSSENNVPITSSTTRMIVIDGGMLLGSTLGWLIVGLVVTKLILFLLKRQDLWKRRSF